MGPGVTIGRYRLVTRLGRGAVGEVWRAEVDDSPVPLALKLVPVRDRARRTAVLTEVRALGRLDHPNVLAILDYGEEPDAPGGPLAWIASELCAGTLVDRIGRLSWREIRDLLVALLAGLAHAHAREVIHRDLKPRNVLYRRGEPLASWRIADLGIADLGRATIEDRSTSGSTGTPLYMAPEQAEGRWRDQGPWTDLYALGCIVGEVVGGVHPLAGLSSTEILARQRLGDVPPLRATIPVPDGLSDWVARLLARDVDRRYRRAADALADLERLDPAPRVDRPVDDRLPDIGSGLSLLPFRRPTFVGRAAEREALLAHAAGAGLRVALISGPAGSGKSQLARWLCEQLHEFGAATVLAASWTEEGGPRDGLASMIERDDRAQDLDPEALVARLALRLPADEARDVAALLRPEADLGVKLVRPAERYGAVRRYLSARGARRRLVLWFDDLQWGAEGLEALRAFAGLDLLVVGTVRQDALPGRPEEALLSELDALRVPLGPLTDREIAALVSSLVGLSPRAVGTVAERVGGSPLFAVQLVTDWAERGLLAQGPAGFEPLDGAGLPSDLTAAWSSRLVGDLPALEVAAILGNRVGRSEWLGACAAAGIEDPEAQEEAGLRAGLLAREDDGDLVFAHGMLRDALRERARVGGRLAGFTAACASRVDPRDPLRLGRLLAAGPNPADALLHLRRAAIVLGQQGRGKEVPGVLAEHEAIRLPGDRRSLAELQVIEARFRSHRGEVAWAEALARQAEQAGEEQGWDDVLADARCALAVISRTSGQRARSAACAGDARERFARLGDWAGVARATALLADVEDDPAQATALAEEALAALRARGIESGALFAMLLLRVANSYRSQGDRERAEPLYQTALQQYVELGDRGMQGQMLGALASIHHERGERAEARQRMDEAVRLLERAEEPRALGVVEGSIAEMALFDGDDLRAEAFARSSSDRMHRAGIRSRFHAELVLVALWTRSGQTGEARGLIDRVRRRAGPECPPEIARALAAAELMLAPDAGAYAAGRVVATAADGPLTHHLLQLAEARARANGW